MIKSAHVFARLRALFFVSFMALAITACGGKDKMRNGNADYGTLVVTSMEFDEPAPRIVDDIEANKALALFELDQSGTGFVTWDERIGAGGNYEFSNMTLQGSEGEVFTVAKLELLGVHLEGGLAAFDKVVVHDMRGMQDDVVIIGDKVVFAKPSAELATAMWKVFNGDEQAMDGFAVKFSTNDIAEVAASNNGPQGPTSDPSFGYYQLSGLTVQYPDGEFKMETLELGVTKDGMGMVRMLNAHTTDDGETKVKVHIDELVYAGINLEKYKSLFQAAFMDLVERKRENADLLDDLMYKSMNPFALPLTLNTTKNIRLDIHGVKIAIDGASLKTYARGEAVTQIGDMTPLTITLPDTTDNKDGQDFLDAAHVARYQNIRLTARSVVQFNEQEDWIKMPVYYVQIDDMLRLDMSYDFHGVADAVKAYTRLSVIDEQDIIVADLLGLVASLTKADLAFAYTDLGLIERGFEYTSASEEFGNMSVALLKGKARAAVSMVPMAGQDDAQRALLGDMAEILTRMIDERGSITFDFKPKMPVDLEALATGIENGEFDVGILGLTIK